MTDHPLDRLFAALDLGNVDDATDCFAPDAIIWHSFDRVETSVPDAVEQWRQMVSAFAHRQIVGVHRQVTASGCVQQHVWTATRADGSAMAWPTCIVAQLADGRITRLDEYLDRAGWYQP